MPSYQPNRSPSERRVTGVAGSIPGGPVREDEASDGAAPGARHFLRVPAVFSRTTSPDAYRASIVPAIVSPL